MLKNPIILSILVLFSFVITLGGAYLLGQKKGSATSSQASLSENQKRLRAKPGTERENARAITTSRKSNETDRTDEKADTWGSMDKEKNSEPETPSPSQTEAKEALENLPIEHSIQKISAIILNEEADDEVAVPYAMLGYLYSVSESDFQELSAQAFENATELAKTDSQRVDVVFYHTKALLHQEKQREALALIGDLELRSIPQNTHYFELTILAATALEDLKEVDKAITTYVQLMDTIKTHKLNEDPEVDNVYRMAAYKLSMLYRKNGQDTSALALARQMDYD